VVADRRAQAVGRRNPHAVEGLVIDTARLDRRAREAFDFARSDRGARAAFGLALLGAVVAYYFVGRHQFFVRDDWTYVLTREFVKRDFGWQHWLLDPQDGHWLTVPVLVYHQTLAWFGLDSYWPFLIPTLISHVVAVLLVRVLCRRNGVSEWTTTLVCTVLLVFGGGWENLVFAIQISYNFSLVAFLAALVLTDHDGAIDRRDYLAAFLGVIGVMSSGFAPIFMVGLVVFLGLRRRWMALLVSVGPQAVLWVWWYLTWGADPAAAEHSGNQSQLPAFFAKGMGATFDALVGLPGLGGIALVATLVVALSRSRLGAHRHALTLALAVTFVAMFGAIGWERVGFGASIATSSRYVHVAAMLITPVFALAVDQLRRISREAQWAGRTVITAAAALNLGSLHQLSGQWAVATQTERDTFALVAGSPELTAGLSPWLQLSPDTSPDVRIMYLGTMAAEGAIVPRPPRTPEETERVRKALGLPPGP
jgi:hypothetical protein